MPIASRRWCGSGDMPGSDICSSAISACGAAMRASRGRARVSSWEPGALVDERFLGRLDLAAEPVEEHEPARELRRLRHVVANVQRFADRREQRLALAAQRLAKRIERVPIT